MAFQLDTGLVGRIVPLSAFQRQAENRQIEREDREYEKQTLTQKMQMDQRKLQSEEDEYKQKIVARDLSMATPENWQAIRPKLIEQGIPDEFLPAQYNPEWASKALFGLTGKNLGGASSKQTEAQRRYQDLLARGYDDATAYSLANGFTKLTPPDQFGNVKPVDLMKYAGGARQAPQQRMPSNQPDFSDNRLDSYTPASSADDIQAGDYIELPPRLPQAGQEYYSQELTAPQQPSAQAGNPKSPPLMEDVRKGTGLYRTLQEIAERSVGALSGNESADPQGINATRQRIKMFNQFAKTALVNNPKFPVAEQKTVDALLVDPDAAFTSSGRELEKLGALQQTLQQLRDAKQQSLRGDMITTAEKGILANQLSEINRVLDIIGGDVFGDQPQTMPQSLPPAGQSGGFSIRRLD